MNRGLIVGVIVAGASLLARADCPLSSAMTNVVEATAAWAAFADYTNNVLRVEAASAGEGLRPVADRTDVGEPDEQFGTGARRTNIGLRDAQAAADPPCRAAGRLSRSASGGDVCDALRRFGGLAGGGAAAEVPLRGEGVPVRRTERLLAIPQLYQNKRWTDTYVNDALGNVIGFQRLRKGDFRDERFTMEGEWVAETYAADVPKVTQKVRYFTRPEDPLTLDFEITDEKVQHKLQPFVPRDRGEFPPLKR